MSKQGKKLKILMANHEFPPIGGGGGTTTRFLAKYLTKLGVDISIATARPGYERYLEHEDGFKLYYVGDTKKKHTASHIPEMAMYIFNMIFNAKYLINKLQPDLIHCFFSIPAGCFGYYADKIFHTPYIISTLGADVPGFSVGDWKLDVYHKIFDPVSRTLWDNSSGVIANSTCLQGLCERFHSKAKIAVIPNGVEHNMFYPPKEKDYSKETVELLFISRLYFQKGVTPLIKACNILKNRGVKNFNLTVIGDGYLREEMLRLVEEYSLHDNFKYLGWKKLEELPDFYREADIFVIPSSMEGMPSVVLQAMSSGLPIIGTKVEGFKEVIEEDVNGLTTIYNDSEDLASAMEELIKNPELREKMSKASIEKAKNHSWEKIAEQYLEVYEKTIYGTRSLIDSDTNISVGV